MHKACLSILLALCVAACGHASLDQVGDVPRVPSREDGSRPSSAPDIDTQVQAVYRSCQQKRDRLQRDVHAAEEGDLGLISAATVAMVLGVAADDDWQEQQAQSDFDRREALVQSQPSKRVATNVRELAVEQVADINRANDDLRGFLHANPDVDRWNAEQSMSWQSRLDTLQSLCP